jgi:hypothetical protein
MTNCSVTDEDYNKEVGIREGMLQIIFQDVYNTLMENKPEDTGWSFNPEDDPALASEQSNTAPIEPISWTGSEFIAQHKTAVWYFGLAGFITLACVVIFFVSKKDILPVIFVAVMGILFGIIASKQPRQLQYIVDEHGISIGAQHYSFSDFKSFSLQHDGAIGYISLLPLHRLKPEISIYFAPEDEQRIFDTLAHFLPNEQREESTIDRLIKRIHF